jgi:hypothetical protein
VAVAIMRVQLSQCARVGDEHTRERTFRDVACIDAQKLQTAASTRGSAAQQLIERVVTLALRLHRQQVQARPQGALGQRVTPGRGNLGAAQPAVHGHKRKDAACEHGRKRCEGGHGGVFRRGWQSHASPERVPRQQSVASPRATASQQIAAVAQQDRSHARAAVTART